MDTRDLLLRAGALLLAAALIVGAATIRNSRTTNSPSSPAAAPTTTAEQTAVWCDQHALELCAAATQHLQTNSPLQVNPAGLQQQLDLLADPQTNTVVLVTTTATLAMAHDIQTRTNSPAAPWLNTTPNTVATTNLVAITDPRRSQLLDDNCSTPLLACLADHTSWAEFGAPELGSFTPTLPDPQTDTVGLLAATTAAAQLAGTPNYSLADLTNPSTLSRLAAFAGHVRNHTPKQASHLTDRIVFGPAQTDIVITSEADHRQLSDAARQRAGDLTVRPLTHAPTYTLVAVGDSPLTDDVAGQLTQQADTFGFAAASDATDDGMPAGGVLIATRDTYQDVR